MKYGRDAGAKLRLRFNMRDRLGLGSKRKEGRGGGEGGEFRPRSRHCNRRLRHRRGGRKPGYPPCCGSGTLREKERRASPTGSRGAFLFLMVVADGTERIETSAEKIESECRNVGSGFFACVANGGVVSSAP